MNNSLLSGVAIVCSMALSTPSMGATLNLAETVQAPTTVPTTPTDAADNVLAVYSSTYGKGLNEQNAAWGIGGGAPNPFFTSMEEYAINGHNVVHVTGTGFNNRTANATAVTTDYVKVHVAVYPMHATQAKIFGDNAYGSAITVNGLVPGQWNYIDVANTINTGNYMLIELVGETEFYLDNFYFSKLKAGELSISSADANGVVTVKGDITKDNASQISAIEAPYIDLSSATIADGVTISPKNPNALVQIAGTVENNAAPATATNTDFATNNSSLNLVVKPGAYIFPINKINYVDGYPVYTGFFLSTGTVGYKYTRAIPANAWATTYLPQTISAPTGLSVYELSDYADNTITLTQRASADIVATTPMLLHNTTNAAVTLTVEGTGDLNLTQAVAEANTKSANGVTFYGNYKDIEGDGTQWGIQNSSNTPELKLIVSGATIGAFRAYFKGLSTTTSAKLNVIGTTTGINNITKSLNTKTNEIYTLSGQKITGSKMHAGVYIINGKKVIIK